MPIFTYIIYFLIFKTIKTVNDMTARQKIRHILVYSITYKFPYR